jgi:hypothetical protein
LLTSMMLSLLTSCHDSVGRIVLCCGPHREWLSLQATEIAKLKGEVKKMREQQRVQRLKRQVADSVMSCARFVSCQRSQRVLAAATAARAS